MLIWCEHCNFVFCCNVGHHCKKKKKKWETLQTEPTLPSSGCWMFYTHATTALLSENGLWQSNLLLSPSLWPNISQLQPDVVMTGSHGHTQSPQSFSSHRLLLSTFCQNWFVNYNKSDARATGSVDRIRKIHFKGRTLIIIIDVQSLCCLLSLVLHRSVSGWTSADANCPDVLYFQCFFFQRKIVDTSSSRTDDVSVTPTKENAADELLQELKHLM